MIRKLQICGEKLCDFDNSTNPKGKWIQSRFILSSRRSSLLRSVGLGGGNTLGRTMIAASDKRWIQKNMCLRYQPIKCQYNNTQVQDCFSKSSAIYFPPEHCIIYFQRCKFANVVKFQSFAIHFFWYKWRTLNWNSWLNNLVYPPSVGLLLNIVDLTTKLTDKV